MLAAAKFWEGVADILKMEVNRRLSTIYNYSTLRPAERGGEDKKVSNIEGPAMHSSGLRTGGALIMTDRERTLHIFSHHGGLPDVGEARRITYPCPGGGRTGERPRTSFSGAEKQIPGFGRMPSRSERAHARRGGGGRGTFSSGAS